MITCTFENWNRDGLRHVVLHAIVERAGALPLVKRAPHLSEGGKWGLPGGFLDRDETPADGALRELLEETGWAGRVLALLRINSRPDRPHEDRQNVACCQSISRSTTWTRSARTATLFTLHDKGK